MTFTAYEQSVDDARPIELHEFLFGSQYYRYTSASEGFTDESLNVWEAQPIIREAINESQTEGRTALTLSMALTVPIVTPYRLGNPVVEYKLYQVHKDDPDQERVLAFVGRVSDVVLRPESNFAAQFTMTSLLDVLDDPGLRRKLQLRCTHALYDDNCGVNPATHRYSATIASVSGTSITVTGETAPTLTDAFFRTGFIEYSRTDISVLERRLINSYTPGAPATLVLDTIPNGLEVGMSIYTYPGCPHTLDVCNSRFGNAANYGGCPFIPEKNPFSSDPIF